MSDWNEDQGIGEKALNKWHKEELNKDKQIAELKAILNESKNALDGFNNRYNHPMLDNLLERINNVLGK